jgi:hypothetical protein
MVQQPLQSDLHHAQSIERFERLVAPWQRGLTMHRDAQVTAGGVLLASGAAQGADAAQVGEVRSPHDAA